MEYKTITYDLDSPTPQQITVPLNSVYGVAVKVFDDGVLQSADLSVDGAAAEEGNDGWKTFELSSGSSEGMTSHSVRMDGYEAGFPFIVVQKDMGYFEI